MTSKSQWLLTPSFKSIFNLQLFDCRICRICSLHCSSCASSSSKSTSPSPSSIGTTAMSPRSSRMCVQSPVHRALPQICTWSPTQKPSDAFGLFDECQAMVGLLSGVLPLCEGSVAVEQLSQPTALILLLIVCSLLSSIANSATASAISFKPMSLPISMQCNSIELHAYQHCC